MENDLDLDKPIRGAERIGKEFDPPLTKAQAFYHLKAGHIPADRMGRSYVSTRRRIRRMASGAGKLPAPAQPVA
jgi:hypothetical protein